MLECNQHFSVWFFWYEELKYYWNLEITILLLWKSRRSKLDVIFFSVILYIKMEEAGILTTFNSNSKKYLSGSVITTFLISDVMKMSILLHTEARIWKLLKNSVLSLENPPIQPRSTKSWVLSRCKLSRFLGRNMQGRRKVWNSWVGFN